MKDNELMIQTCKLPICRVSIWTLVLILLCYAISGTVACSNAYALSLYVGRGAGTIVNDSNFYYGGSRWPEMTSTIDAAFDTVTLASDLSDLDGMLAHDRLWVDSRSFHGDPLSPVELANIQSFIATGRRVVLMGERGVTWSTQILSIVGGVWAGEGLGSGVANALPVVPELTRGVGSIDFSQNGFGQASGGTPLFDRPWSTLWDGNVLTVLDVVVFNQWRSDNHAQYGRNVVEWLAVPEPTTINLLALTIVICGLRLRRPVL